MARKPWIECSALPQIYRVAPWVVGIPGVGRRVGPCLCLAERRNLVEGICGRLWLLQAFQESPPPHSRQYNTLAICFVLLFAVRHHLQPPLGNLSIVVATNTP